MKLKELFARDINRQIEAAVVVSNQKAETIKAEIDEYVFTEDIIENLFDILNTVISKKNGKTGIWINGYYGSGKSHFIKYVHYCLSPETAETAFNHFIESAKSDYENTKPGNRDEITESNLKLLQKKAQSTQFEHIMFNVEDETDDGVGERLTRIFLSMFNRYRGYTSDDIPTALLLDKYLDKKGKFEEFKKKVQDDLGFNWKEEAADVVAYELSSVLDIAKSLVPELDIEALHNKLTNQETYRITIADTLIPEFKEYLKDKPDDYRLLFLVDEVSQYVGGNKDILLNFQSIVEQVSDKLDNKVWIACTAQQSLDEVVSTTDEVSFKDEFGKILGRFDTRISLESNDAAYITQKRVLDKNAAGTKSLSEIYTKNKDAIENQFKLRHDLYKGYTNDDDFFLAYPFVPYQFKLIGDVFQQFQNLGYVIKEVKANERSVLTITHFTAKKNAEMEVGKFIAFDAFFNELFNQNLTHRGRKAIENAMSLSYVKDSVFAQRVVKTLFMVSNLPDASKMTFPSNLDNLTILLMDDIDQNKLELQKQIKAVLDKLLEESIIREEKGSYLFFNEDEIDVQMMIKNKTVTLHEKMDAFDELFRPVFKVPQKFTYGSNDFAVKYNVDEKNIFRKGDFELTFQVFDTKEPAQRALDNSNVDLTVCIAEWLYGGGASESLRKDFEWFCKTEKYFLQEGQNASGDRLRTHENFRIRQTELKKKMVYELSNKFKESRFISGQEVLESSEVSGNTPDERLKNLITKHLDKIYKHHKLANGYAKNSMELRANAASKQVLMNDLDDAEEMVNNFITQHGNELSAEDIINNFSKAPFGWRDESILDIMQRLVKKKKREFVYRKDGRYDVVEFINKALTKSERVVCSIRSGEEIDQKTIDQASADFRDAFNVDINDSSDGDEVKEMMISKLSSLEDEYLPYQEKYHGTYPFGDGFNELLKEVRELKEKRLAKQFFKHLSDEKESLKAIHDKAKAIRDFTNRAIKDYDSIRDFYEEQKPNFTSLSVTAKEHADRMQTFFTLDEPQSEFRHIVKAYDELKKELKNHVKDLRDKLIAAYKETFARLKSEADKQGVKEPHVYADEDATLARIGKVSDIVTLNLEKSQLSDFESDQLNQIIEYAAQKEPPKGGQKVAEPEAFYVKRTGIIRSEEDLDNYLKNTREEMLKLLKENKTIILK
jgi:predicted transcriptional regulator